MNKFNKVLVLGSGALKIGQVLGATLKETCDSLTALTADKVEGAKEGTDEPAAEASKTEEAAAPVIGGSVEGTQVTVSGIRKWRRKALYPNTRRGACGSQAAQGDKQHQPRCFHR